MASTCCASSVFSARSSSTLEDAKRVYGDEHVSTLYATEVLARVYSHSGDYAAALPLFPPLSLQ